MTRALALVCTLIAAAPVAADGVLLFPDGATSVPLRVAVTDGGAAPDLAWETFLGKLHVHFDRDGDGALSEAEAKRVFPLPLATGGEVAMDFAALDTDRDGKATPAEFRAFYRAKGFAPVAVLVRPAAGDALALGDALFAALDRDADGTLSAAELKQAPALLKRFDDDEDEVLTATELLSAKPDAGKPAGLKLAAATPKAAALVFELSNKGNSKAKLEAAGEQFALSADGARLLFPGGACSVSISTDDPATGFRAAKSFYVAQFKAAAGDKPVAKSVFADDPTAQVLAGLFDAADRDGDGKLTRAELDSFFDLIELGIGCRVVVTATDRGRNLFDLIDTNGDDKLDLAELTRAGRTLPDDLAKNGPLARAAVPASYSLNVARGPVGDAFGPVPFGAAAKPKPAAPAVARGPAWFRAMDKNGDGFVSAREFVGPPELFAKLDADGDGRLSVTEAESAKP